ncbi:flagellar protein FlaG [Hyphobacterium sp. HN65]|uniref:Flagellar protein FlaG n=1 Tax=Hyphobacterium lacteum TaxID=3116575 RepID=A0ABU7LQN1_9PROT|nr:flagellar protein FlaG [Hyphobacterium sp. HN65]MEE2526212.1 flagellar protein FlaG [Hyphobacterium sp. HN65]
MNELVQKINSASSAAAVGFRAAPAPVKASPAKNDTDAKDQNTPAALSFEELKASVDRMAQQVFAESKLAIEKHEGANTFVYRLVDSQNGSVVRQWPTEDMLSLREYLRTKQGGLVDQRV